MSAFLISLTAAQWASLIAIPVLTALLVILLVILLSKRNKTDTLAQLAYKLRNLKDDCSKGAPDFKALKKLDGEAGKCSLLCEVAVGRQGQDIGSVPSHVEKARKILHAMVDAKTPPQECGKYLPQAARELERAYTFLIDTLGIKAAPPSASLRFFNKNMKSDNAKKYLESLCSSDENKTDAPANEKKE